MDSTFILRHTRLQSPPFVPELHLHLAEDIMALWQLTGAGKDEPEIPPPFWAFAWVGGQAIARYLLDHPAAVTGKRVLDFATGSGLCAIAAMKAGAAHVLAADLDPFSATAVAMNAQANSVDVAFTTADLLHADPPETDLILAGDICYEEFLAARALGWLATAHARGCRVLIGDPGRAYFPRDGLIRLAAYEIPTTRDLEGVPVKKTQVVSFFP
jgi:predicted nicotinamide N-methyase